MDERADGRGPFHCVWQPDIERRLRALSKRAEHQKKRNPPQRFRLNPRLRLSDKLKQSGIGSNSISKIAHRSKRKEAQHDPQRESEISNSIDNERLLRRIPRAGLLIVVSNQQIRA